MFPLCLFLECSTRLRTSLSINTSFVDLLSISLYVILDRCGWFPTTAAGRQANGVNSGEAQRHGAQARTWKPAQRQKCGARSRYAVRWRLAVSLRIFKAVLFIFLLVEWQIIHSRTLYARVLTVVSIFFPSIYLHVLDPLKSLVFCFKCHQIREPVASRRP